MFVVFSMDDCLLELDVYNPSHYVISIENDPSVSAQASIASQHTHKYTFDFVFESTWSSIGGYCFSDPAHSVHATTVTVACQKYSSNCFSLRLRIPRCKSTLANQNTANSSRSQVDVALANSVKEHISNVTDVRWKFIGRDGHGCLKLEAYQWTVEDIAIICTTPVSYGKYLKSTAQW